LECETNTPLGDFFSWLLTLRLDFASRWNLKPPKKQGRHWHIWKLASIKTVHFFTGAETKKKNRCGLERGKKQTNKKQ
jgi:hypothetical protein